MPEKYNNGFLWNPEDIGLPEFYQPSEEELAAQQLAALVHDTYQQRESKKRQRQDARREFFNTPVQTPATFGSATAPAYNVEIPRVESTVGKELGTAAAYAAAPAVFSPGFLNFAGNMAVGLPAFEVADRIPTLWGHDRATVQGGNLLESGFRAAVPEGKLWQNFEDTVAPYVNQAGQLIAGLPVGAGAEILTRGAAQGIMNKMARNAARKAVGNFDYMAPVAEMMSERPTDINASTRLGSDSSGDIQALMRNGDLNPMDLDVSPMGSGQAPANLMRAADGTVLRTPDGYVVRAGSDLEGTRFYYDNAGRRYNSVTEATGGSNQPSQISSRLTPEQNQALREQIQRQVNETLDRMNGVQSQRLQPGEFDWDAFERGALADEATQRQAEAARNIVYPARFRGSDPMRDITFRRIANDLGVAPEDIHAGMDLSGVNRHGLIDASNIMSSRRSVFNTGVPEESQFDVDSFINRLNEQVRTSARNEIDDYISRIPGMSYEELSVNGIPDAWLDANHGLAPELRTQDYFDLANAPRRAREAELENRMYEAGRRLNSFFRATENMSESELDDVISVLGNSDTAYRNREILSRAGLNVDDINIGRRSDSPYRVDVENELNTILNNARTRRAALEQARTRAAAMASASTATPAATTSPFVGSSVGPVTNDPLHSYYADFDEAIRNNDLAAAREAIDHLRPIRPGEARPDYLRDAHILQRLNSRGGVPDELLNQMRESYANAASSDPKRALEAYMNLAKRLYSSQKLGVKGDPNLSERDFLRQFKYEVDDGNYRKAVEALNEILENVPESNRNTYRLSKQEFEKVYKNIPPVTIGKVGGSDHFETMMQLIGKGLNEHYNGRGVNIDFTKLDTPQDFGEIKLALRDNGIVAPEENLPLDVTGLSYKALGDPRGSYLANLFQRGFTNPEFKYRGLTMAPNISRSVDSHYMDFSQSAKNYGTGPGQITWQLSPVRNSSNGLERNHVYIQTFADDTNRLNDGYIKQIFEKSGEGKNAQEIANELGLNEKEVQKYINEYGAAVFGLPKAGRKAALAGLDLRFTPQEIEELNNIYNGIGAIDGAAYEKALNLARFVRDFSADMLNEPLSIIASKDPSLPAAEMVARPTDRLNNGDYRFLNAMLYPHEHGYSSGKVGYLSGFSVPGNRSIIHKHGGLIDRLKAHYGDNDKIRQAIIKARGGKLYEEGGGYAPSDSIKNYIKQQEAFRSKWYKDGNGIDTVGYGFTGKNVAKLYPNGMTRKQADEYFDSLVDRFAKRMVQLTPNIDRLTQNQKDALFSYFYNIGEGNYSTGSPKMQQALRDFDLEAVMQNIDAGYNDKKNPGLRKRRDYERELFGSDIRPVVQEPVVASESPAIYAPEIQRFNTQIPLRNEQPETAQPFLYNPVGIQPLPRVSMNTEYSYPAVEEQQVAPSANTLLANEIKSSLIDVPSRPMLFNSLIPTSVQNMINSRDDGGLLLTDYRSGGKIHIKPENRGKFTALKKRTGHSASWFKAHGTPAQKKMAVFALNAKKWKH